VYFDLGSFETYIQGLLKEIYTKHPDRLQSDRSMTIRQVVERRDDILEFLIDQEIAHIGALAPVPTSPSAPRRSRVFDGGKMPEHRAESFEMCLIYPEGELVFSLRNARSGRAREHR
jgi:hypothetical protein